MTNELVGEVLMRVERDHPMTSTAKENFQKEIMMNRNSEEIVMCEQQKDEEKEVALRENDEFCVKN